MTISDRVRQIRLAGGYTMKQFAERVGISDSAVSQIEKGRTGISDQTIRSICREYGVNEIWLRTGVGEMNADLGRAAELAEYVKKLLLQQPESFKAALVTALLRFDPEGESWAALEKIYQDVKKEYEK